MLTPGAALTAPRELGGERHRLFSQLRRPEGPGQRHRASVEGRAGWLRLEVQRGYVSWPLRLLEALLGSRPLLAALRPQPLLLCPLLTLPAVLGGQIAGHPGSASSRTALPAVISLWRPPSVRTPVVTAGPPDNSGDLPIPRSPSTTEDSLTRWHMGVSGGYQPAMRSSHQPPWPLGCSSDQLFQVPLSPSLAGLCTCDHLFWPGTFQPGPPCHAPTTAHAGGDSLLPAPFPGHSAPRWGLRTDSLTCAMALRFLERTGECKHPYWTCR